MTPELLWREGRQSDRYALQQFNCTYPTRPIFDKSRKTKHHPYPWELEVQSRIREFRPPIGDLRKLFLGFSDESLRAVWCATYDRVHSTFILNVIARSLDARSASVGSMAMSHFFSHLPDWQDELGVTAQAISAYIDPKNTRSRELFISQGFFIMPDSYDGYDLAVMEISPDLE